MNDFGWYTGISLSVHVTVCPSVYKILVSVKALVGVLNYIVTALVYFGLQILFVDFSKLNSKFAITKMK